MIMFAALRDAQRLVTRYVLTLGWVGPIPVAVGSSNPKDASGVPFDNLYVVKDRNHVSSSSVRYRIPLHIIAIFPALSSAATHRSTGLAVSLGENERASFVEVLSALFRSMCIHHYSLVSTHTI